MVLVGSSTENHTQIYMDIEGKWEDFYRDKIWSSFVRAGWYVGRDDDSKRNRTP